MEIAAALAAAGTTAAGTAATAGSAIASAAAASTLAQGVMMGAAIGGGLPALTGGNRHEILRGALGGGLTGGVGAGIAGLAGGQTLAQLLGTEAAAGIPAAMPVSEGIPSIIQGTGFTGSTAPSVATNLMGGDPLALAKLGADVGTNAAGPGPVSSLISQASTPAATTFSSGMAGAGPTGVSSFARDAASTLGPAKPPGFLDNPVKYVMENPKTAIYSGLAGAMAAQPQTQMPGAGEEPESRYRWPRRTYRWTGAQGGIASLPGSDNFSNYDLLVGDTDTPTPRMMAGGGEADLGSYSDGGRMLRGPGDGMSDSIPGVIANKRPAQLADGEFVVPADVVSHLGNGSTDAGARQLYAMMDKVRKARTGTKRQGREINPRQFVPA